MVRQQVPAVFAREQPVAPERGRGEEVAAFGVAAHAERARGVVLGVVGGPALVAVGAGPAVAAHPEGETDERGYIEAGVVDVELGFQGGDLRGAEAFGGVAVGDDGFGLFGPGGGGWG